MALKASVKVSYTINAGQTFIARLSKKALIEPEDCEGLYASTQLKPCLAAILLSRPDVLEDAADYTICCLDHAETEAGRNRRAEAQKQGVAVSPVKAAGDKVWEGKGMLSWVMQEAAADEDDEPSTVSGKLSGNTLHVTLSLTQRAAISRSSFLDALRASSAEPPSQIPSPVLQQQAHQQNTSDPFLAPPHLLQPTPSPPAFNINVIQPTPMAPGPSTATASSGNSTPVSPLTFSVPPLASTSSSTSDLTQVFDLNNNPFPPIQPTTRQQTAGANKRKAKAPEAPMTEPIKPSSSQAPPPHKAPSLAPIPPASTTNVTAEKTRKLKFDKAGCINCGVQYAMLWRKKKNGQGGGKLCNSCGVFYNKHSTHRPITEEMRRTAVQNGQVDDSVEDIAPMKPAKQRKIHPSAGTEDTSPSSQGQMDLDLVRRSPRRGLKASTGPSLVTASSPGPSRRRTQSGEMLAPTSPGKNARALRAGKERADELVKQFFEEEAMSSQTAVPSSSGFSSAPSALFDSDIGLAHSDLFSTITSDAPMPEASTHNSRGGSKLAMVTDFGNFDQLFSQQDWGSIADNSELDIDMDALFSDAGLPGHVPLSHSNHRSNSLSLPHPFNQAHSDAFSDLDPLPPSSPPTRPHQLFPAALSAASEGGSPSMAGDSAANTPGAISSTMSSALEAAAANGITWSEDAIAALTNALLGQTQSAKRNGEELSEQTLQDLFSSILNAASPENGGTPTPNASKLDIQPVAEVNAEVALEIWNKEVQAVFTQPAAAAGRK